MNPQISGYLTGDYLFHGSIHPNLKLLVPGRPVRDAGRDPRNKEEALYATGDVCAAIAFSLIRGFRGTFRVTRSDDAVTVACFPASFSEQLSANAGSLYVLRRSDFSARDPWQWKAYTAVAPVAEIEVGLQDYLDLGGRLRLEEVVSHEEDE